MRGKKFLNWNLKRLMVFAEKLIFLVVCFIGKKKIKSTLWMRYLGKKLFSFFSCLLRLNFSPYKIFYWFFVVVVVFRLRFSFFFTLDKSLLCINISIIGACSSEIKLLARLERNTKIKVLLHKTKYREKVGLYKIQYFCFVWVFKNKFRRKLLLKIVFLISRF